MIYDLKYYIILCKDFVVFCKDVIGADIIVLEGISVADFVQCIIYLAFIGITMFIAGRLLPKDLFRYDRAPFRSFALERDGAVYLKLGVKKWKDMVPDMSRILPGVMPSKKAPFGADLDEVVLSIQETCVAEFTHAVLAILGIACIEIWEGVGGAAVSAAYFIGNMPYIVIQRYNRPKLVRIAEKLKNRERLRNL